MDRPDTPGYAGAAPVLVTAPASTAEMPGRLSFSYSDVLPQKAAVDLLVIPVFRGASAGENPGLELEGAYAQAQLTGAPGEDLLLPRRPGDPFRAAAVLLLGMGDRGSLRPDDVRRAAQRVSHHYRRFARIATTLPQALEDNRAAGVRATIQGLATGAYRFEGYRAPRAQPPVLHEVCLLGRPDWQQQEILDVIRTANATERAVAWARDLVNTPARDLTPADLADRALAMAEAHGVQAKVWGPEELETGQFGGILGVNAGSRHAPRLVELRYEPPGGARRVIGLAGKGITFDSGGLALKQCTDMFEMKSDMAGAAAVLAAVQAVAELKPPGIGVIAALPLAENMPGSGATRPGDVLLHRNGATTEVSDPDAEGRLVLADALAYLAEQQPDAIIDAATLTYSCIAALGLEITAALGNDDALMTAVIAAGEAVGEPVWELPLWRRYRKQLHSDVADLRNESKEDIAGAIVAALFLESFVGGTPWVHLDIGGTAFVQEATDDTTAGGTGVLVRTLVHLLTEPDHGSAATGPLREVERVS